MSFSSNASPYLRRNAGVVSSPSVKFAEPSIKSFPGTTATADKVLRSHQQFHSDVRLARGFVCVNECANEVHPLLSIETQEAPNPRRDF